MNSITIAKLREVEVFLAEGVKVGEVIRWLGVNKITYYRWRQLRRFTRRQLGAKVTQNGATRSQGGAA